MVLFLFLFAFIRVVLSRGTVLADREHSTPRFPFHDLSERHFIRGLFSRQECVDPGYTQCVGYDGCCPEGGSCCIDAIDDTLVACCNTGELCATTIDGGLGCCTPGVDCIDEGWGGSNLDDRGVVLDDDGGDDPGDGGSDPGDGGDDPGDGGSDPGDGGGNPDDNPDDNPDVGGDPCDDPFSGDPSCNSGGGTGDDCDDPFNDDPNCSSGGGPDDDPCDDPLNDDPDCPSAGDPNDNPDDNPGGGGDTSIPPITSTAVSTTTPIGQIPTSTSSHTTSITSAALNSAKPSVSASRAHVSRPLDYSTMILSSLLLFGTILFGAAISV